MMEQLENIYLSTAGLLAYKMYLFRTSTEFHSDFIFVMTPVLWLLLMDISSSIAQQEKGNDLSHTLATLDRTVRHTTVHNLRSYL